MEGFLILGGIPLTVGALVGFLLVLNPRRYSVLAGMGVAAASVLLLASYLSAPSDPGSCHDCGEYLGRWWEPFFVVFILLGNLAGWAAGLAIGAGLREFFGWRRDPFARE